MTRTRHPVLLSSPSAGPPANPATPAPTRRRSRRRTAQRPALKFALLTQPIAPTTLMPRAELAALTRRVRALAEQAEAEYRLAQDVAKRATDDALALRERRDEISSMLRSLHRLAELEPPASDRPAPALAADTASREGEV